MEKQLDVDVSPPASVIILNQYNWQMASNCFQMYNTVECIIAVHSACCIWPVFTFLK